jgi:hypothetical protein
MQGVGLHFAAKNLPEKSGKKTRRDLTLQQNAITLINFALGRGFQAYKSVDKKKDSRMGGLEYTCVLGGFYCVSHFEK